MGAPRLLAPTTISGGIPTAGAGTLNTVALWTPDGFTLGNSVLTQAGSTITNATGAIRATGTTAGAPAFTGSDTDTGIYFPAANQMRFATAGSFVAAFDSTGNFGIGETSPSTYGKLAITVGTTTLALNADATRADVQSYNKPLAINRLGNNTLMNEGGGNVGIGTASPTDSGGWSAGRILDVRSGSAGSSAVAYFGDSTRSTNTQIGFYGSGYGFVGTVTSHEFRVLTNNTARIRIASAGDVGIGTTSSPAYSSVKLVVNSAGGVNQYLYDSGSSRGIYLNAYNSGGSGLLEIGGISGALGGESLTSYARIGSASIDASIKAGYGLKLPATPGNTDPNTLDAYADGGTANSGGVTWTPTLAFGGASVGITYDTRVGRYTRVGNMIFAHCYIKLTSKGSSVGDVTIDGLPTSANLTGLRAGAGIGNVANITFADQIFARIGANATAVTLTETTNAGAETALTDADFTATSEISFTISYPTT